MQLLSVRIFPHITLNKYGINSVNYRLLRTSGHKEQKVSRAASELFVCEIFNVSLTQDSNPTQIYYISPFAFIFFIVLKIEVEPAELLLFPYQPNVSLKFCQ